MKRLLYVTTITAFFVVLAIGYNSQTTFACGMDSSGCLDKAESSLLQEAVSSEEVTDPVCAMKVEKDPDKSIKHKGHTYYFCSKGCMEKFQKDVNKYACPCADLKKGCYCYHCTSEGKGVCDCVVWQKS
jgi:YHS domain-containing protein